jgi:hypothetical protein
VETCNVYPVFIFKNNSMRCDLHKSVERVQGP